MIKKLFILVFAGLSCSLVSAADTKISAFVSTTTLNPVDIIPVVTNPGSAPANFSISKTNLLSTLDIFSQTSANARLAVVATDTSTIAANLATEITNRTNGDNTLTTRVNAVAVDTGTLRTSLNTVATDTTTIASSLATEITNRTNGDATLQTQANAIAVATGTLRTDLNVVSVATGTLRTDMNTGFSNVATATATLTTRANSIAVDTGTIQAQVNTVTVATGTLRTDLNAVSVATGTLRTDHNAVSVATGTLRVDLNATRVSTGTLQSNFPVSLSTNTMGTIDISAQTNLAVTAPITQTGDTIGFSNTVAQVETFTSSVAVSGNGGVSVTFGLNASSITVANLVDGTSIFWIKNAAGATVFRVDTSTPVPTDASYSIISSTNAGFEFSASTVAVGGPFHVLISTTGHVSSDGPTPTITSCGAVPNGSVYGNDHNGLITIGGGSVTSCVLTFVVSFGAGCTVRCLISDNVTTVTPDVSVTPTAMTLGFSASLGGGTVDYNCEGVGPNCQ